jgi:hypothetical protein
MSWKERAAIFLTEKGGCPLLPKPPKAVDKPFSQFRQCRGRGISVNKKLVKLPDEAIREHLEERAAIQEYDGGLTRKQAETKARRNMRVYQYRLTDSPESRLIMIAPGCDLEEARENLCKRFGDRLLDVCPQN